MRLFLALLAALLGASLPRLGSAEDLRAILPAAKAFPTSLPYKATGSWEPTFEDVDRMESKLRRFLLQKIKDSNDRYWRECVQRILGNYLLERRQYVGLIVGGKRMLHANFFPRQYPRPESDWDWKLHYYSSDDGGPLFWNINFRCDESEFFGFEYGDSP